MKRRWLVTLALMIGWCSLARGEPLEVRQVPAEVKWVAHLDLDAARGTKLAEQINDKLLSQAPAKLFLFQIRSAVGIDLFEDIQSVTAFGFRFAQEEGVVLVRAEVDRERLIKGLGKLLKHDIDAYGEHELHTWTERKKLLPQSLTGCFHRPELIVLGRDPDEVRAALDVLDGKSTSLADGDSPLATESPPGTIFEARASNPVGADDPFVSPVVRQSERIFLALGEHEGELFASARLETKSMEAAERIRSVVEGLRAMAQLQCESDEDLQRLFDMVEVTAREQSVLIDWRGPAEEIIQRIERAYRKLKKAQQAK